MFYRFRLYYVNGRTICTAEHFIKRSNSSLLQIDTREKYILYLELIMQPSNYTVFLLSFLPSSKAYCLSEGITLHQMKPNHSQRMIDIFPRSMSQSVQFNTRFFFISNPSFHFRPKVAKVVFLSQAKSYLVGFSRILVTKKFSKARYIVILSS